MISEIKSQINIHLSKWSIMATDDQINEIVESVISGNSAFQIIFDATPKDTYLKYTLTEFKPLKREYVTFKMGKYGNNSFSYDGGKRFQWNENETLLIDINKIRELKLNQILSNG